MMAHPTDDELEAVAQRLELIGPTDVEVVDMLRACKTGDAPDHETWNAAIEAAAKVAIDRQGRKAMGSGKLNESYDIGVADAHDAIRALKKGPSHD